jgi:arylsulfatase A-like enzyme
MYRESDPGANLQGDPRTENAHPLVQAYRAAHEDCVSHQDEAFVRHVRPTYMGLIKQVDDHIGRLVGELERLGRMEDTLIVFTSDHGDHLGDHGLGEKELFYEQAVRVPLIVVDPSAAADATRGSVETRLVEAVDIVPTILEATGADPAPHLVEGRSLLPLLRGEEPAAPWRDCAFSELDYAFRGARRHLQRAPGECQAWMARTARWKYVHHQGLRPQLFDLDADPLELVDRGDDPALASVRQEMKDRLAEWQLRLKRRTDVTHDVIEQRTEYHRKVNILIGVW